MIIYADGSSLNNNLTIDKRIGGCAWINATTGEKRAWCYRGEVTNNRSEMFAAIGALNSVREKAEVTLMSDSQYVQVTIDNKRQREATLRNGKYYTATGKECTNNDCLTLLFDEINRIEALGGQVRFEKVRGHADDKYNIECDALAVSAARKG